MSVQNLSRFAAHLMLDYNKLRTYLLDPENFLPKGETEEETLIAITDACGDLSCDEITLIRRGNWQELATYVADEGPRPVTEDQGSYPNP